MSNPTELPDLLPCPFCGERDVEPRGPFHLLWGMHCNGCNVKTQGFVSKEDAIAAWNRRAQPEGEAPQAVAQTMANPRLPQQLRNMASGSTGASAQLMREAASAIELLTAPAAQHAESGAPVALNGYIYRNRAEALAAQSQGAQAAELDRAAERVAMAANGYKLRPEDFEPVAAQSQGAQAAPDDRALLAALAEAADVFMKGGVAPLRPLIDRAKAVAAQQAAAPGALVDTKLLVDIATGVMDQRGMLSDFTEVGIQRFCEELQAAFDKDRAAQLDGGQGEGDKP